MSDFLRNPMERDKGLTVEELNKRIEDKKKHDEWLATQSPGTQQIIRAGDETGALIQERKKAHGDWDKQAAIAQQLKTIIKAHNKPRGDNSLSFAQTEALEMIAVKMSRILAGDPNHADHWDDIAGYARLGKQGHQ